MCTWNNKLTRVNYIWVKKKLFDILFALQIERRRSLFDREQDDDGEHMADERRSMRGGMEAGPYASDARVHPQSTRMQRPSMAARVDVGGRGEELSGPDTENGVEAAGSGDSGGAGDERLHGRRPAGFKRRLKVCQIYFHFMHGLIPPLDTVKVCIWMEYCIILL